MTNTRLGVMMFLEYLIWGSWLPLLALYLGDVLGFSGGQIGWIFATQAIACLAGLYFGGQIADRMLSTEKLLAVLHLIGGVAMFALAYQTTFWSFFFVMLAYQLAYMPTMSLTNAVVFPSRRGCADGFRQDPPVGNHRLDRRQLAVRLHPRRQDRARPSRGAVEHLHRRRHRVDRAGGVFADAAAHAARQAARRRERADAGHQAAARPGRCSCCSSRR